MTPFVLVAMVVGVGAFLLALQVKRMLASDESLIEWAQLDLVQRILPIVGTPEAAYMDKDALWEAIGGMAGLVAIHRASAAIGTLAARRARQTPMAHTEAERLFVAAMYTRLLVLLAMVEAVVCRSCPMIPRVFVGALARLYCDMAAGIEAVESIRSYA